MKLRNMVACGIVVATVFLGVAIGMLVLPVFNHPQNTNVVMTSTQLDSDLTGYWNPNGVWEQATDGTYAHVISAVCSPWDAITVTPVGSGSYQCTIVSATHAVYLVLVYVDVEGNYQVDSFNDRIFPLSK